MKLNYKKTFLIGLAFFSTCAFWQLYDTVIPLILSKTFGLKETITGAVMALDNVLGIFLLPLFGALSDRTHTKLGRRMPFIILGSAVSITFLQLIPAADNSRNFILFFFALGTILVAMGTYRSPAVALMPDVTPKPLRSKGNAIINLMGTMGGFCTLIMISLLVPKTGKPDYTALFACVGALMALAVAVLAITTRENALAEENEKINTALDMENGVTNTSAGSPGAAMPREVRKSLAMILLSIFLWFTAYNAITTAYSRYAVNIWGLQGGSYANALLIAIAVSTICFIPIGYVSTLIGRRKTILIGIVLITISYLLGALIRAYSPLIYIIFAFTGVGWASINVNSYPMVVEMSRGCDVGKYTGLYYTFSMLAQIVTPILSGFLLERFSYRTLFPYAATFSILSFITMLQVKHGDSKPPKKMGVLDHFDDGE